MAQKAEVKINKIKSRIQGGIYHNWYVELTTVPSTKSRFTLIANLHSEGEKSFKIAFFFHDIDVTRMASGIRVICKSSMPEKGLVRDMVHFNPHGVLSKEFPFIKLHWGGMYLPAEKIEAYIPLTEDQAIGLLKMVHEDAGVKYEGFD